MATDVKPRGERNVAVDMLRGLVMIVMALDHVRDFFGPAIDPTDLARTTPALFLTRWITHYCAPVFVLLAGTAVHLSESRGKSKRETAWFLLTRGAWLVFAELTIIRFLWLFDFGFHLFALQVIWAIGWSMLVLAAVVCLPLRAVGALGVVMILGHNAFDRVHPHGTYGFIWSFLHEPSFRNEPLPGVHVAILYPLVPWVGVIALGYACGAIVLSPARRRIFATMGSGAIAAFVVLRATNIYGDAAPWSVQPTWPMTIASFLNCTKYPPSLMYLLMTLGPAFLGLAALDRARLETSLVTRVLVTFGRVPFFYYALHLLLIHTASSLVYVARGQSFFAPPGSGFFRSLDLSLRDVYGIWLVVVLAAYPLCRWFAGVKARNRDVAWLSYV